MSAEETGEFAVSSTDPTAEHLGMRGLAMWRTLYMYDNRDPRTPFFNRVCRRACATGYSMGGGAAQNVAFYATPEDNIICQAPIHAAITSPRKVNGIDIPTLLGSSTDDTVTPRGPIGLMYAYSAARPPLIQVVLQGNPHILGSLCGNNCPFDPVCCIPGITNVITHIPWMTAFFKLYLQDKREYAAVLWDDQRTATGIKGIADEWEVAEVFMLSRIGVESLRNSVKFNENSTQVVNIMGAQNLGTDVAAYTLKIATVWSPTDRQACLDLLNIDTGSIQILRPGGTGAFPATVSAGIGLGANCTVGFQVQNNNLALSRIIRIPFEVECELSNWSQWTEDCTCCNALPSSSRTSRASRSRSFSSFPRTSLEGPLQVLRDVSRLVSEETDDLQEDFSNTIQWIKNLGGDEASRQQAAEEISEILNGDSTFGNSLDCGDLKGMLDFNGDGNVAQKETETALEFLAVWLAKQTQRDSIASRSSFKSISRESEEDIDADIEELNEMLMALREGIVLNVPEPESEEDGFCQRTRDVVRSELTVEECIEKIGIDSVLQYRTCNPDCPDPPPPPSRNP